MAAPQRDRTVHAHHRGQVQFGVADIGHRRTAQDQVGDIARGTPDAGEGGLDGRDANAWRNAPAFPAIALDAQQRPQHLVMAQRARVGPAVQVAQDGHGAAGQQALRDGPGLPGSRRRRGSQAVLAIAARPAQDMRIRHGTRSSLEWGRRLAGESETLYAGSGDMSRTRGLRFGKGIRATRARLVHSEYTAFPQATHRLAHRDMHRQSPPLVRAKPGKSSTCRVWRMRPYDVQNGISSSMSARLAPLLAGAACGAGRCCGAGRGPARRAAGGASSKPPPPP